MDEIEEIQKRVIRHPDAVDLYIKRLPSKTRDLFVKFANDYFVGDYGFAFKSILDQFLVIGPQQETMMQILDELIQRIEFLEKGINNVSINNTSIEAKKIKTLKRKGDEKKDE